jgi:hypothetical protein
VSFSTIMNVLEILLMFLEAVKNWKLFKCFAVKELWISFSHQLTKFLPHWDSPIFLLQRFTIWWPWTAENPIKVLSGFNVFVMTFATPVRQFCADCSWNWLRLLHCTHLSSCKLFRRNNIAQIFSIYLTVYP